MSSSVQPTLIDLPAELRGTRVLLRPYQADDAELMFAAVDESREHLRHWVMWTDRHASVDDTRDYCVRSAASWLLRSDLTLAIFNSQTGRYLGGTGLHQIDWDLRTFEIGYWLRTSAVGQGYVSEAVQLLTGFAIDALHANRVSIACDAKNERSRRVAERAGYVLEGCLRNALATATGEPADMLIFSLVPSDRAQRQAG